MISEKISLTDFKQNLGEVVNRAAYGDHRILLLARGKARAALISVEDLQRFEQLEQAVDQQSNRNAQFALLDEARAFREQQNLPVSINVSDVLNEVREGRLDDLIDLR